MDAGPPASPRPLPQTGTLSAARLISAMSIRCICSIAWVARWARPGSGSLSSGHQLGRHHLPRDAELVLEPAALALLAALGQPGPVVVSLLLVGAHDLEGDRLVEPGLRAAVEAV